MNGCDIVYNYILHQQMAAAEPYSAYIPSESFSPVGLAPNVVLLAISAGGNLVAIGVLIWFGWSLYDSSLLKSGV